MFTKYLLPFEITSVLILMAIVGAITLARQGRTPLLAAPGTPTEETPVLTAGRGQPFDYARRHRRDRGAPSRASRLRARTRPPGAGRKKRGDGVIPLTWYLALSAVLFTIGVVGVIVKRNVIQMFMCIELMLNAVNLTFVAFSSYFGDVTGQLFVFIVMTVAAAEAAVGLGIIIAIFRNRESLDVDDASMLRL